MSTETKRLSAEQWNDLVGSGQLKEIDMPRGFLMIGQVLRGRVEYQDYLWDVVGWHFPKEKPYIMMSREWE